MVKLFVGNLPENVDSNKLKQVFQQFCRVTECDVVKNYAFVHVEDADVDPIIQRLNGYNMDGKAIHIQKSTSKLRPQPGMTNKCFRCGSEEHKTPHCPQDPNNQVTQTIKIDLTRGVKRPGEVLSVLDDSLAKKAMPAVSQQQITGSIVDQEIPLPADPTLHQLHQQYLDSRSRYFYFRDQLLKEIEAKKYSQPQGYLPPTAATVTNTPSQLSASAVSYQPFSNVLSIVQPNAPYAQPVNAAPINSYGSSNILKAPYASGTSVAPYAQHLITQNTTGSPAYGLTHNPSGTMTTQQYLMQQSNALHKT